MEGCYSSNTSPIISSWTQVLAPQVLLPPKVSERIWLNAWSPCPFEICQLNSLKVFFWQSWSPAFVFLEIFINLSKLCLPRNTTSTYLRREKNKNLQKIILHFWGWKCWQFSTPPWIQPTSWQESSSQSCFSPWLLLSSCKYTSTSPELSLGPFSSSKCNPSLPTLHITEI